MRYLTSFALNILCLLACLYGALAYAQYSQVDARHSQVALVSKMTHIVPGENYLALRIQAEAGWHTYWKNPGDTGLPTRLKWSLPVGFTAGDIQWPVPERINYQGLINYGYHGDTWLRVPIYVTDKALENSQGNIKISVLAKWLICKEVCIPDEANIELTLPVGTIQNNAASQWSSYFDWAASRTPKNITVEDATFTLDAERKTLSLELPLGELPAITKQPNFFVVQKGVVQNTVLPEFSTHYDASSQSNRLSILFAQDKYLNTPPKQLDLVVVASDASDVTQAISAVELSVQLANIQDLASSNPATLLSNANSHLTQNFGLILLFALLGGLILNAMPCVFPVLSLKIVSLIEAGNHAGHERRQHGLAYTAGVVISFMAVALVLIILRVSGEQIGWGFQLQSPAFIASLVYVLFVLGLSLSGFIELGTSLQNLGAAWGQKRGLQGSFFTGVLATVVATPCTAPFMGTAMGYALSQPAFVSLTVFAVMGLGLALPFLLIAYIPALANALPKPGNWMLRLKELLAFPIYLTIVWLLWVFMRQTGSDALAILLVGAVVLVFSLWLWRLSVFSDRAAMSKSMAILSAMIAVAIIPLAIEANKGANISESDVIDVGEQSITIEVFADEKIDRALSEGRNVFVNMTADWCITCKVNEKVVFNNQRVIDAFSKSDTLYLVGDWTNSDADISQYLERFNRNGVPLYVYYQQGKAPVVLPQILTPSSIIELTTQ